jgi:hypothetical protein
MGIPCDVKNEKNFQFLYPSCRKMATGSTEEEAGGLY